MKKLLWISVFAPYDSVDHAGGKTENYYLKYVQSHARFDITVLTLCKDFELPRLDLARYGIKSKIRVRRWKGPAGFICRGFSWLSKFNLLNRYAGMTPRDTSHFLLSMLREVYTEGYRPDCIIMQWTEALFLLPQVRKLYPGVPLVVIEEDVAYLGQLRRAEYGQNLLRKAYYRQKYQRVKRLELGYLEQADLAILNNKKDLALVKKDGLHAEPWVWSIYFQSYLDKAPHRAGKDIVFYGAMFREENWKSAEWFIRHVMPLLKETEARFVVMGSRPNKKLFQYSSDRVVIKGFVEDISTELLGAMCLVAPLVLGAGIKTKILEALSCGIPVLTNTIGIEGIPAVDGESYFHCEAPQDYARVITGLLENRIDTAAVAEKAKAVVRANFNYENDAKQFADKLEALTERPAADSRKEAL